MSQWVRINGTEARIRGTLKDVSSRAMKTVRDKTEQVFVEIADGEARWLESIAKDFGVSLNAEAVPPEYAAAPCGVLTTNVSRHLLSCKKCKSLRRTPEGTAPHSSEPVTLFKAPGLQDFSLNGLLSLMRQKLDEAMELASSYESAIKAIEGLERINTQLNTLHKERDEHAKALEYFIKARAV